MIDGAASMVLVEKASKSGVEISSFDTWYRLAAYAIRQAAVNDEAIDDFREVLRYQNLDTFVTAADNLNGDNLFCVDDAREDGEWAVDGGPGTFSAGQVFDPS